MSNTKFLTATVLAVVAATTIELRAAEETRAIDAVGIQGRAGVQMEADLSDKPGSVEVSELRISGRLGKSLNRAHHVALETSLEVLSFDFADAGAFARGQPDPFENVTILDIGASYLFRSQKWQGMADAKIRSARENGIYEGNCVVPEGTAGVMFQAADSLAIGVGVVARGLIEEDPLIYPIPIISWQISEDLSLEANDGAWLAYRLDGNDQIVLGAHYEIYRFRMATPLETQGIRGRVGEYQRVPVTLAWQHSFSKNAYIGFAAGGAAWHHVQVDDKDGGNLNRSDIDPALGFAVNGGLRF